MTTKYYKCFFKSQVVLPATANNQGNIRYLDFIPGRNFLGIVAREYDSFGDKAFEVFHSGVVSFGDATLEINGHPTYKTPLSFHYIKTDKDEIYNRTHLNQAEEASLRSDRKQLKQIRKGYISANFETIKPSYSYAQKSSYDKKLRRSKDSGMFRYMALEQGQSWIFKIDYDDESLIQPVEDKLIGSKLLGKSKSAQYGQVEITKLENINPIETFESNDDISYIYAVSRIALVADDGSAVATPTIESLGVDAQSIEWSKSYINTDSYAPYNYIRATNDYGRVFIEKGSVIAIRDLKSRPTKIGAFISEGFGDVIVNPIFLQPKEPKLHEVSQALQESTVGNYDKNLIDFLQAKHKANNDQLEVAQKVSQLYEKLIGPSKSQWGQIRSFASIAESKDDLIAKIDDYISRGVAKKQWEGKQDILIDAINNSPHPLELTKLLAMIVSKHTKGGKND